MLEPFLRVETLERKEQVGRWATASRRSIGKTVQDLKSSTPISGYIVLLIFCKGFFYIYIYGSAMQLYEKCILNISGFSKRGLHVSMCVFSIPLPSLPSLAP